MFKDKMVVRGGFGLGYNRLPNTIFLNARGNPPGLARFGICCGHTGEPFANNTIPADRIYAMRCPARRDRIGTTDGDPR